MRKPRFRLIALTRAAVVAALYVGLTLLFADISFGPIQFRISECLTVLPFFFPETIFGLFIGCLVSNFLTPFIPVLDICLGTLATLIAAILTWKTKHKWLAPLPPVLSNALIVPLIFYFTDPGAGFWAIYPVGAATVGLGELVVCYGLGIPLLYAIEKLPVFHISSKKESRS